MFCSSFRGVEFDFYVKLWLSGIFWFSLLYCKYRAFIGGGFFSVFFR